MAQKIVIEIPDISLQGHLGSLFVVSCDVDARGGEAAVVVFTNDPALAKAFDSAPEAIAYWRRQSAAKPLRDDGKPNRPLTAFTATFLNIGDET